MGMVCAPHAGHVHTLARGTRLFGTAADSDVQVQRFRSVMLSLAAVAGALWSVSGTFLLPTDPLREVIVAIFFIGATASGIEI